MRDVQSKRPYAKASARVFLALALAASMSLPFAGTIPAVADEPGEQRIVFKVTRADDASADGNPAEGTLRWAIDQANTAGSESYTVHITFDESLQGGAIEINGDLPTIRRPMDIDGPGGGITICKDENAPNDQNWRHFRINRNEGTGDFGVTLNNLTLEGPGQAAASGQENGGIFVGKEFTGHLSLSYCTLKDNVNDWGSDSDEDPDGMGNGGAINVWNDKTQLSLENCTVEGNKAFGSGGGVYIDTTGSVVVENSNFVRNEAGSDADGGGGLMVAESVELSKCRFEENRAGSNSGGVQSAKLKMTECVVLNNEAGTESGQHSAGGGVGATTLTMESCEVTENQAGTGGGIYCSGSVDMTDCTVSDNTAFSRGGGLFAVRGGTVRTSSFERNTSSDKGGAIVVGDESGALPCVLEVVGSTISGNQVQGGSGGGLYLFDNSELTLTDVTLSNNTAEGNGGGVCLPGGLVTIDSCTVSENESAGEGGGISTTDVSLANCTLSGNEAQGGGGVNATDASLVNCTLSGNVVEQAGGGVQTAKLEMHGCLVAGNHDGGGASSELRVGEQADNGTGAMTDAYGKKNLIGAPAAGLSTVMDTTMDGGVEVGKLADNGGATPTIMIAPDGPAQDVIYQGDYNVPALDQRGDGRPFGPAADIGAVEVSKLNKVYAVLKPFDPYRGDNKSLTATIDAPGRSVVGVEVAGRQLELGTHYTVTGDTVIELKPAFLRTLKNGTYDVTVTFTNGHAQLPLKVELKPSLLARTGDDAGPVGWTALLAASMAAVAVGIARRRLD